MISIFVDSGHWIAVLNPADGLHANAHEVSRSLAGARFVTSEMVLTEVLNFFAAFGSAVRERAERRVRTLKTAPEVTVVAQSSALFERALDLYARRPDKQWSFTDCGSLVLMDQLGIAESLTHDHHFVQAGFTAMLRDNS